MAVGGAVAGGAVAEMVVAEGEAEVRAESLVEVERAAKEGMVVEEAAMLYCHFYALVSVRDAFWDRASSEWLRKQTTSVADTLLAHAAGLVYFTTKARKLRRIAKEVHAQLHGRDFSHSLVRTLAEQHPAGQISCRDITFEMLDAVSVCKHGFVTFTYRDRGSGTRDHRYWVAHSEFLADSAFVAWLLLDSALWSDGCGPSTHGDRQLWCGEGWQQNVSNQATFKAAFADPSKLDGAVFEFVWAPIGWRQTPEPEPRGTVSTWSPAYSPSSSRDSSRSPSPIVHRSSDRDNPAAPLSRNPLRRLPLRPSPRHRLRRSPLRPSRRRPPRRLLASLLTHATRHLRLSSRLSPLLLQGQCR